MIIFEAVCPIGMYSFGMVPVVKLHQRGRVFVRGVNEDHNNDSNGAGKSSLLNAIKEITFGKNDSGKSGPHVLNKHKDWDAGQFGALWFWDHLGNRWRVFSIRKWKGAFPEQIRAFDQAPSQLLTVGGTYTGTDIFLERWDTQTNVWMDERPTAVNAKTMKDVHTRIQEILGMTYEQFCAYVFLGQQAESSLVYGTSGEREKIVQAVTDVSIWDRAADMMQVQVNEHTRDITLRTAKISGIKTAIQQFSKPTEQDYVQARAAVQHAQDDYNAAQAALQGIAVEIAGKQQKLAEAKSTVQGIEGEFDILAAEERHARERYADWEPAPPPASLTELEREYARLGVLIDIADRNLDKYTKLQAGTCFNCGQAITAEHLAAEVERLRSDRSTTAGTRAKVEARLTDARLAYDDETKRAKKQSQDQYERELQGVEQARAKLQERLTGVRNLEALLHQLQTQHSNTAIQAMSATGAVNAAQVALQSLDQRIQQFDGYQQLLQAEEKALADTQSLLEHEKWTERNLRRLKLQEYESALQRLNELIAEELINLWGPGLEVRFVTAQEKSRGGVKQELELLVSTPNKEGVPIELFSGGERKEIVVAVFKAGRRLVRERGLGVNISAIDELDKDLSDGNTDRLVDAFQNIAEDSATCVVISHNARLLNTMQFDETWVVRKRNEFANVEQGVPNTMA